MSQSHTANVAIGVLRELGVLFEAPGLYPLGPVVLERLEAQPAPGETDHAFHAHTPLWTYEAPGYARPYSGQGQPPVYEVLAEGTSLPQALGRTRLVALLGAADTPALRQALSDPGAFLLIFEHDTSRLARFALSLPPARLARRAAIFHGEVDRFVPPLSMVLGAELFDLGFPAFFALPELLAHRPDYASAVETQVEALFYRFRVYPLSGQSNNRGLPLRPMLRGLFYDQQLHAYENIPAYASQPDIQPLRKAFPGETAILVAAGPDLSEKIDFLRRNRDSAVIIAVNNALKPMLAAGVRPHFAVVNDTSLLTARSWQGLPPLPDIPLVAHCLCNLGGGVFPRMFLFGAYRPEIYGQRPGLRLHGSVITTAFSLARHMGCARCVLVGAQLSSADPGQIAYSKGSIHESGPPPDTAPSAEFGFPQLFPVTNSLGVVRHTNLNFLDAAMWMLDEIKGSGIPCVNTTDQSILFGPGVEFDPEPVIEPSGLLARRLSRLAAQRVRPRPLGPMAEALGHDLGVWRSVQSGMEEVLALHGQALLRTGGELLAQFDQNNISYLVQRFADFDNRAFHAQVFEGDEAARERGLRSYLEHVRDMAATFVAALERGAEALTALRG